MTVLNLPKFLFMKVRLEQRFPEIRATSLCSRVEPLNLRDIFLGCNFLRISQIVRELIHFIQRGMQCLLILQSDKILEK